MATVSDGNLITLYLLEYEMYINALWAHKNSQINLKNFETRVVNSFDEADGSILRKHINLCIGAWPITNHRIGVFNDLALFDTFLTTK